MNIGAKYHFVYEEENYDTTVLTDVYVYAFGYTQALETLALVAPSKKLKFLGQSE